MTARSRTPTSSPPCAPASARLREGCSGAVRRRTSSPTSSRGRSRGAGARPPRHADVIVGCAMAEGEQGMNVARIGVLLAGAPGQRAGHDDQPLLLLRRAGRRAPAADRIRTGTTTSSSRPHRVDVHGADDGQQGRAQPSAVFAKDENVAIAYGMGITRRSGRAVDRSRARSRMPSPSRATVRPPPPSPPATPPRRSCPTRSTPRRPTSPPEVVHRRKVADTDEGPPRLLAGEPREAAARLRGARLVHRRQQLADVRRRPAPWSS